MDDNLLSLIITCSSAVCFTVSAWATFWIWRGRHGGWSRLAAAYPAKGRADAQPRRWQSMTFRPARVSYPGLITFRATIDGLHAVPILPVRFGHESVLIPWDDIEIFAVDTYPADRLYDLKFARVPQIEARVNVSVAQFIRRAADNSRYFAEQPEPVAARKLLPAPKAGPKPVVAARQSVA